jgi:hypothetical protein
MRNEFLGRIKHGRGAAAFQNEENYRSQGESSARQEQNHTWSN